MPGLRPSSPFNRVGIYFDRQQLFGCLVKRSIAGKLQHRSESVQITDEDYAGATRQLLAKLSIDESIPTEIIGAIPTDDCIVVSMSTDASEGPEAAEQQLRQSLRQSTTGLDQLAFDELTWHSSHQSVISLTATAQDRIGLIREAVSGLGHRWRSLQPAPSSLTADVGRSAKRERTATRLFVGETSLLGVMTQGANLVHWQSQPLPRGEEERGIALIAKAIESEARAKGFEPSTEGIRIHGRHELQSLIDSTWLQKNLSRGYEWLDGPAMNPGLIAQMCADQFYSRRQNQFNFVRSKPGPPPDAPTPDAPTPDAPASPERHRSISIKKPILYMLAISVVILVIADQLRRCREDYTTALAYTPSLTSSGVNPHARLIGFVSDHELISQSLDKPIGQRGNGADFTSSLHEVVPQQRSNQTALTDRELNQEDQGSPIELVFNADYMIDLAGAPSSTDQPPKPASEAIDAGRLIMLTGVAQLGRQSWAVINGRTCRPGDPIAIEGYPASTAKLLAVRQDHVVIGIGRKSYCISFDDPLRSSKAVRN
ncbi:hypothetical protein [Roseiconus lacunae]|uniref:hypothetical protein n=1 Tax=Roseiconus lacunae TaxID=2605694 RepID=UPI001E60C197|nr:hypothetical protein [Roseiconus lacunae]MCD0461071.1 hypothetical protein [Roseiconus lacunae]